MNTNDNKISDINNFYDWLIGFIEAEGSFFINDRKTIICFIFSLGLNKRDLNLLKFIQANLNLGKIYPEGRVDQLKTGPSPWKG